MVSFFSNRELAVLIWIGILLLTLIIKSKVWQNIQSLINGFFDRKIFLPFISLVGYVILFVWLLYKIHLWDFSLVKDTLFWFFSTAFVTFFNLPKADEKGFFKNLVKDNLKVIIILEFLLNFYTFSFLLEFILVPIIFIISVTSTVSEYQTQKDSTLKYSHFLKNILAFFGLFVFVFVLYKTIIGYKEFLTVSNLKAFFLPIVFTTLCLPFFYLLAIYIQYNDLFIVLNHLFKNKGKELTRKVKLKILCSANFSLKRLKKIRRNSPRIASSDKTPEIEIADVLRIPLHKKSPIQSIAKLSIFNDIEKVRKLLSKNGIGDLREWNFDDVDEFHCMTDYFSFGSSLTGLQNNITYYLTGGELYIKKLELVLNIYNKVDNEPALQKFEEVTEATFKCLSLSISSTLIESVKKGEDYCEDFETYNVKLIRNISMIVSLKLIIESK